MSEESQTATRQYIIKMRAAVRDPESLPHMPESEVWSAYVELRQRGWEQADQRFLGAVKALHRRRVDGVAQLAVNDPGRKEHEKIDNPFLGELWRAYKRSVQRSQFGSASKLIRDMESELTV